jgi:hypothetical protein
MAEYHAHNQSYDDARQGKASALKEPDRDVVGGLGRDALRIAWHP